MDIKKMPLTGWGKNFSIFSNVYNPVNNDEIINIISLKNYKKFFNFDKNYKNSFGILFDDGLAGVYTLIIVLLLIKFFL